MLEAKKSREMDQTAAAAVLTLLLLLDVVGGNCFGAVSSHPTHLASRRSRTPPKLRWRTAALKQPNGEPY